MELTALLLACAPTVAPETMAAVIRHESASRPYAVGLNGPFALSRQPRTKAEAVELAKRLHRDGHNFDVGLSQVNSANVVRLGVTFDEALEPCSNIALGAQILTECFRRARLQPGSEQAALNRALSCYNTGHFERGVRNGYVQRVRAAAQSSAPVATLPESDPHPSTR